MTVTQAIHGLEAYSGKNKPIHRLIAQAMEVNAVRGEICTASILIGSIGVLVDAIHTCAFDGDVWSEVQPDGTRTFSPEKNANRKWFADGSVEDKWSYSRADWTNETGWSNHCLLKAAHSAKKEGRPYAEYFARRPSIRCVVFDRKADAKTAMKARVLARFLKTVAMPVDANTRLEMYQAS